MTPDARIKPLKLKQPKRSKPDPTKRLTHQLSEAFFCSNLTTKLRGHLAANTAFLAAVMAVRLFKRPRSTTHNPTRVGKEPREKDKADA